MATTRMWPTRRGLQDWYWCKILHFGTIQHLGHHYIAGRTGDRYAFFLRVHIRILPPGELEHPLPCAAHQTFTVTATQAHLVADAVLVINSRTHLR